MSQLGGELGGELDGKRLELLRELMPAVARISVLVYPRNPWTIPRVTAIEALARPMGIRVTTRPVSDAGELDGAFAMSAADHDQAILFLEGPVYFENQPRVVALAAQLPRKSRGKRAHPHPTG